jgi:hypothetical protein
MTMDDEDDRERLLNMFAAAALTGLLANPNNRQGDNDNVKDAWDLAVAMMDELARRERAHWT